MIRSIGFSLLVGLLALAAAAPSLGAPARRAPARVAPAPAAPVPPAAPPAFPLSDFHLQEATIADVHKAILARELTATQLVGYYLKRIEAYNGPCVRGGVDAATGYQLGDIAPIENAGKVNALITLNLRGKRSQTLVDGNPEMPDALEAATALDAEFARTGKLKGPLHGIPFAIKDQFDTFDMRTTSGAAARYANDRPPRDATVVARLRAAGAIILAKANMGEYASGDRSTYGGTTCNPYDTSRSAGRSSGGSGAAVAANLVMCALGEETGPSARNPASNGSLVGIVATNSLVSRAGIVPASLTRDRAGVLCRSVKDAATVLAVIAGYDPRDPATAESLERSSWPYEAFADNATLTGVRIGVVREFMQVHSKADEEAVRLATAALADLTKAGATLVDPGPEGALFTDAIAEIVPALDTATLSAVYREMFSTSMPFVDRTVQISGKPAELPPELSIRLLAEREPQVSGEGLYAMDRYLRDRGDANIKSVRDLLAQSTFYNHAPIDGVTLPPRTRLEGLLEQTVRVTRRTDSAPMVQTFPVTSLDITGWHAVRTTLQMLVNKVMADHRLDALVYPTKTIPAPLLAAPVEPTTLKSIKETVTQSIEGVDYDHVVERVVDLRAPLTPRLSPNGGFPVVVVPAGFTSEVYDRAVVRDADGSKHAGDLLPPKPVALPISVDFLGRRFSEPVLIRIAAAYEQATRHRRPPAAFPPLPGEP
jgi:Asp-tRNA(Asn)/Glu-tRNA(Gln) amidotransferase A subunit family amidase